MPINRQWMILLGLLAALGCEAMFGSTLENACVVDKCQESFSNDLLTFSHSGAGFSGTAQAWAPDDGTFKAYAQFETTNFDSGTATLVSGETFVNDVLYMPGVTGTISFTFDISGTDSLTLSPGGERATLSLEGLAPAILFAQSNDGGLSADFQNQATFTASFSDQYTYSPLFEVSVDCDALHPSTCSGSGTMDFTDTVTLSHIAVYDSTGALIADPEITSDSGFDYESLTTPAVPEPALGWMTALLCAAGLAVRRISRSIKPRRTRHDGVR